MGSLRCSCTTPAFRLAMLSCLALVSSAVLLGCTSHFTPNAAVVQAAVDCPSSMPNRPGPSPTSTPKDLTGSVPKGFVPAQVFVCRMAPIATDSDGSSPFQFQQEELAGDFDALLAALAVPSDTPGGNVVCTADLELLPGLWLVNATGGAINAAWPVDKCGKSRGKPDTQKAIDALRIVDVQVLPFPGQGK